MPRYRFGVLDQSPIAEGRSPAQAVAETVELAIRAEALGYTRYWLAEHHSSVSFAGPCPEILMAHVAARTRSIRVGSGGVMMLHYSALKIAEQFRMLETLYPGRIDLGVGRAPGADTLGTEALCPNAGPPDVEQRLFEAKLRDLSGFLRGELRPEHPHARLFAMPGGDGQPEPWLLGSGTGSAALAAKLGWSFCFAHFIGGASGVAVVDAYRQAFKPSPWQPRPRVAVGAFVLAADDDAEAQRLVSSTELWFLNLQLGRRVPFPTPAQALAHEWSPAAAAMRRQLRALRLHGGPATVARGLERLAMLYETDEFLVVTITHDHQARLRSYELLAEIAELDRTP
ncbi:Limonene 1,2-monooxygenase [Enhygromyxa salina]|uniref:Luciferase-like monooxygenase n=1 Tax=Enhygromyxa salina TaxID=215803 RepID=A0A2S9XH64_9BACT|nr:LLM class flavin-dependent oxidoreductase [Enhygromyxa salina]PRP92216.1 Limonene 1,2-monooxygenase [Enhygromyxa salina]